MLMLIMKHPNRRFRQKDPAVHLVWSVLITSGPASISVTAAEQDDKIISQETGLFSCQPGASNIRRQKERYTIATAT
jgi:hypothetical protein